MEDDPMISDKALLDRYGSMKQPPKLKSKSSKACPTITALVIVSAVLALLCFSAVRIYLFECVSSSLSTDCSGKVCAKFINKLGRNYVISDDSYKNFTEKIRWAKKNNDLRLLLIDVTDAIQMAKHFQQIVSFCHKTGVTVILSGVDPADICNLDPNDDSLTQKRQLYRLGVDGIGLILDGALTCKNGVNVKDFNYWLSNINQNRSKKLSHVPLKLFLQVSVKSDGTMTNDVQTGVRQFSDKFPIEDATLLLDNRLNKQTTDIPNTPMSLTDISNVISNILVMPSFPQESSPIASVYFYYLYLSAINQTFVYDLDEVLNQSSAFSLARNHYVRLLKLVDLQTATSITQEKKDSHHIITYTIPSGTYCMLFFTKSPHGDDLKADSLVMSMRVLARCQSTEIEFANKKGTTISITADQPALSVVLAEKAKIVTVK